MRRYGRAVLGGTFDRLHLGHESLLETAFRAGREVAIGLTSERFLAAHPKPDRAALQSYSTRRRRLVAWLRKHHPRGSWKVVPIDEPFGGSVAPGVGVLVVSADTVRGGRAVNAERRRRGLPPVPVVVVPLALADDLLPVASRRIRAGSIDARGRRTSSIRVALRATYPADTAVVTRAVRRAFPKAVVVALGPGGPHAHAPRGPITPKPRSPSWDLSVRVARARTGGWRVEERSPRVRLRPVLIPGSRPADLARGLRSVLRPAARPAPRESF